MGTSESVNEANLTEVMRQRLPPDILTVLGRTGELAFQSGQKLYLVGGVVRDMLLGRVSLDLDIVVEGDALKLAQSLSQLYPGGLTVHRQFGTARLRQNDWVLDFATARLETYSKPGALPDVRPGNIREDLFRRDFTINAMAVCLEPSRYGHLLDPYGGKGDLDLGIIRILHQKSFTDDATRMFRAVRYEQRLGFHLEAGTETRLRQEVSMLDTISPDRVRHELEIICKEERPELSFMRAAELSLLQALHPQLTGDGRLAEKFAEARRTHQLATPPVSIYLALLVYPLSKGEVERFVKRINPQATTARVLRDTVRLRERRDALERDDVSPSAVFHLLEDYALQAVQVNVMSDPPTRVKERLERYLSELRHVRPLLNGEDLRNLMIAPGPKMGQVLRMLQDARLDGKIGSREDEISLVQQYLGKKD